MAFEALGALDSLESLEKTAIDKSLRKQQERQRANECRKLKERYAELVKRREKLKDKLQNQLPVESEDDVVETVTSVWKSRLEARLNAYRLTGVSATRTDETCVLVRFDTSYRGEFKEAYYMQVVRSEVMGIGKHTIPAFIPLANLAQDYLNSDLHQFLQNLSDYLRAFVIRREEVKVAQALLTDRGYIKGQITLSLAVDVVQFYLQQNTLAAPAVCVILRFNNLLHLIPGAATIKAVGDAEELPESIEWKRVLTSSPVSQSLDSLCPEIEQPLAGESDFSDME